MANLRDRGYPSAKEYEPPKRPKITYQNEDVPEPPIMTDDVDYEFGNGIPAITKRTYNRPAHENNLRDAIDLYTAMTSISPYAPKVAAYGKVGADENYDPTHYNHGVVYKLPVTDNTGFLNHYIDNRDSVYSGAINGLNSLLGDDSFKGALATPAGMLNYGYSGDVLFGNLKRYKDDYYLRALKNLLERDTL